MRLVINWDEWLCGELKRPIYTGYLDILAVIICPFERAFYKSGITEIDPDDGADLSLLFSSLSNLSFRFAEITIHTWHANKLTGYAIPTNWWKQGRRPKDPGVKNGYLLIR